MNRHPRMSSNSNTKTPRKNPFLWTTTYVNAIKPSKVYLYILRNAHNPHEGTRPISVAPHQYLSKLQKHNISLESLNIPITFVWSKRFFEQYGLSTKDATTAHDTARQIWNIVQSQLTLSQSTVPQCVDTRISSANHNSESDQSIHSKLDLILNKVNSMEHAQQARDVIAPIDNDHQNEVLQNIVNTQHVQITDLHRKNRKLQKEKTQQSKNLYYYKHIAQEQRNTLHRIGLSYGVNTGTVRCFSNVGYSQLMRRVSFIQKYIN
eukprot:857811_1